MALRIEWHRPLLLLAFLPWAQAIAPAQQPKNHPYGDLPVETLLHTYGPFDLQADSLQQVPPIMEIAFPEDLWLVGYGTRIVDSEGNRISRELQCHTFFGTPVPSHHGHENVVGLFSDGYTENFLFPDGFGLLFKAGDKIFWNPMFNNRAHLNKAAAMKLSLNVIWAKNLKQPLRQLQTTFRTIQAPDLYYVPPGRDIRERTFELPFAGRIHALGTHIHPYGVSLELINVARNESIWKAVGRYDEAGRLVAMPIYANKEGYPVQAGDQFKLVAIYNNTSSETVDAMAGMFILYAPQSPQKDSGHNSR